MLSDEEKKAIETIEELLRSDEPICEYMLKHQEIDAMRSLLHLIEKQSKEIEHQIEKRANQRNELAILNAKQVEFNKLVNTLNSYKGQFKRQQKEIEVLKNKKPTFLIKDLYNPKLKEVKLQDIEGLIEQGREEVKDKIKAIIEELEKDIQYSANPLSIDNSKFGIKVLQSLLRKEFPTTITKEELEKRWKE